MSYRLSVTEIAMQQAFELEDWYEAAIPFFPTSTRLHSGRDLMMDAPGEVPAKLLDEPGIW